MHLKAATPSVCKRCTKQELQDSPSTNSSSLGTEPFLPRDYWSFCLPSWNLPLSPAHFRWVEIHLIISVYGFMLSLEAESIQIPFFLTSRCFFQFSYHILPVGPTSASVCMAVLQIGLLKWSNLKTTLAWIELNSFCYWSQTTLNRGLLWAMAWPLCFSMWSPACIWMSFLVKEIH